MTTLLFYQNPVALNRETHKHLRIKLTQNDFGFAARTNSTILAAVEFPLAARDYPILFSRTADGKTIPVALLGLRDDENLFVGPDGAWDLDCYLPAFVRRYPFVPAETGGEELAVCIDEGYAGFGHESGEPLFDARGEPTGLLRQALALLQDYHVENKRTEAFVQRLEDMELLKEVSVQAQMKGGSSFSFVGLRAVDEVRLTNLDRTASSDLFKNGYLAWIYAHLISQANLGRLVHRLAQRLPGTVGGEIARVADRDKAPPARKDGSIRALKQVQGRGVGVSLDEASGGVGDR